MDEVGRCLTFVECDNVLLVRTIVVDSFVDSVCLVDDDVFVGHAVIRHKDSVSLNVTPAVLSTVIQFTGRVGKTA
jgi:hypothetical protein